MKLCTLALVLGAISTGLNASNRQPSISQSAPVKAQPESAPESRGQAASVSGDQSPVKANEDSITSFRPGAGTIVVMDLPNGADAKKCHVGDPVEGVVRQDLLFKGKIIVPNNAKVVGHVTEAVSYTKEHGSRLGMVFDKIILPKNKGELPFQYPAVIEAVAAPIRHSVVPTSNLNQLPIQMEKGKSTGGAAMDALQSNPNIMGGNFPQTTGVISGANRGVIGLKDLSLEKSTPEAVTIVGNKRDVKLAAHTQMVLRVTDGKK